MCLKRAPSSGLAKRLAADLPGHHGSETEKTPLRGDAESVQHACPAGQTASVHVALGLLAAARMLARDEHEALELGHEDPVLIEHARVHLHGPAVGLGSRLGLLQHL